MARQQKCVDIMVQLIPLSLAIFLRPSLITSNTIKLVNKLPKAFKTVKQFTETYWQCKKMLIGV